MKGVSTQTVNGRVKIRNQAPINISHTVETDFYGIDFRYQAAGREVPRPGYRCPHCSPLWLCPNLFGVTNMGNIDKVLKEILPGSECRVPGELLVRGDK